METLVCLMGGGATRLHLDPHLDPDLDSHPNPHLEPDLDPDLDSRHTHLDPDLDPHQDSHLDPHLDPHQPADTNLDPDFCQEFLTCPLDPDQLLHRCEDVLRDRPPRLHRKFIRSSEGSSSFRVMQWNILAQALAEGVDCFIRCPVEALSWSSRKFLILEEILRYRPDVLCLQEVDHYHDTLRPVLERLGYAAHFCPKPWSPCLAVEGNNGPDGCALFYNRHRFHFLDSVSIRLSAMKIPTNQVAVATVLQCRSTARCVCVAVTHLKARSGCEWLRSRQGSDLLLHLQNLLHKHGHAPLLVCGDFNAVPSEEVYRRFLASPLELDSAYRKLSRDGLEEPGWTTWKIRPTGECRSTLDYIWYSRRRLRVDAVLDLPTDDQIGPDRLPSFSYPSDHLSLVCDFSFREEEQD